jgi:hypothetical protein
VRFARRVLTVLAAMTATLTAQPSFAGHWGDPWGELIWGADLELLPEGLQIYAPTGEFARGVDSCHALLDDLGGPATVTSVTRIVELSQTTERCDYVNSVPSGADFPLQLGLAYMIEFAQPKLLSAAAPNACPPTQLATGVNLVGVGRPLTGLSCHDLLTAFGPGAVSAVERLDRPTASFAACSIDGNFVVSGSDFPILPGEGYLVHSVTGSALVNLNDPAHATCTP